MEGDHIGPQVRHAAVEQGEDAELHTGAQHAEQGVQEKVPVTPINTA